MHGQPIIKYGEYSLIFRRYQLHPFWLWLKQVSMKRPKFSSKAHGLTF